MHKLKEGFKDEKVLISKDSWNIYGSLANLSVIRKLKWEIEDFCFYYLNPVEYKKIAKLLNEKRIEREKYIEDFILLLRNFILIKNIKAEIYGRPKHIYSIWRKMQKKNIYFDKLFDIRAVRIIVESLKDCYIVLEIVHKYFCYLSDQFDDYIANPKPNGYQSIHTVILGPNVKTIEIQIRTKKMHEDAELGIAAHWKYKSGVIITSRVNLYENHLIWLSKLIALQKIIRYRKIFYEIYS